MELNFRICSTLCFRMHFVLLFDASVIFRKGFYPELKNIRNHVVDTSLLKEWQSAVKPIVASQQQGGLTKQAYTGRLCGYAQHCQIK